MILLPVPDIHITYCSNHSAKSFHYDSRLLVVSVRMKVKHDVPLYVGESKGKAWIHLKYYPENRDTFKMYPGKVIHMIGA